MKTIIIQGSARSTGNTDKIAQVLKKQLKADRIDLCLKNIHPYSYEHHHSEDDLLPLMRTIVEYDLIILLTPVYWYTMSGLMKNFLDRITDCLKVEKETGRKLRGKSLATVACGSEPQAIEGFFTPFVLSAEYLGMTYLGSLHTYVRQALPDKANIKSILVFIEKLNKENS
ncbi:MAG: NAD(P)H-dependent oxidoreductase [Eudoraea sp.]